MIGRRAGKASRKMSAVPTAKINPPPPSAGIRSIRIPAWGYFIFVLTHSLRGESARSSLDVWTGVCVVTAPLSYRRYSRGSARVALPPQHQPNQREKRGSELPPRKPGRVRWKSACVKCRRPTRARAFRTPVEGDSDGAHARHKRWKCHGPLPTDVQD